MYVQLIFNLTFEAKIIFMFFVILTFLGALASSITAIYVILMNRRRVILTEAGKTNHVAIVGAGKNLFFHSFFFFIGCS